MTGSARTLLRTSPAYEAHVVAGARWREKARWRRVDWYESNAEAGDPAARPEGVDAAAWSPAIEAEHRAVRERVGLLDLTSFGKVELVGPGAVAALRLACANDVARGVGRLTYTQMLDESGGVVGDVTVGRLAEDRFLVVTGTAALEHDIALLRRCANELEPVAIRDVTGSWGCFAVWGPRARDVLAPLVDVPLDTASAPYMSIRAAQVDGVPVLLSRITFVGELGWEVYVPTEYGRWLYAWLVEQVREAGGRPCGYKAIDSLRAEKGYLYLGADLTADHTPFESGMERFVRADRDFVGGAALAAAPTPTLRLGCLTLDHSRRMLGGGEPVRLPDGSHTTVTSAGVGYTVGRAIAFAYLPVGLPSGTAVTVVSDGDELAGTVAVQPLYDPAGEHVRD